MTHADLGHPAEVLVTFLHCSFWAFPLSFSVLPLLEKSHLQVGKSCSIFLRSICIIYLEFLSEELSLLPHLLINANISKYQHGLRAFILHFGLECHPMLFCCLYYSFGHWGASVPLGHTLINVWGWCSFFKQILTFCHYKVLQPHLVYSLPQSQCR